VGLVDDQQLVRAGFRMLIDSQPDLSVVVEAGDGAQAVQALTVTEADVVLMDVRMPVMDGIAATAELTKSQPHLKMIVLTTFDLDEYVMAAIRAGASGFLLKDAPPEELLEAIRTVNSGDAVIAPSATKRLISTLAAAPVGSVALGNSAEVNAAGGLTEDGATASSLPKPPTPTHEKYLASLTSRELEVLQAMARGLSNQEIASEFYVSEATVKTHVSRVLAKLYARDRVQAVVFAFEAGIA
jgi:DNA-binding NarL/FixJ family response regulator